MPKQPPSLRPIPESHGPLAALLPSWQRHLRANGRTVETISTYMQGAVRLDRYLADHAIPLDHLDKTVLEQWRIHLLASGADTSASNRWRSVKQLLRWLTDEGELAANPSEGMPAISTVERNPDVLSADEIRLLLATCKDRSNFEDVRDRAIILFLCDNGARLSGTVGIEVDDVDLDGQCATIVLKGGREHVVPFGAKTAEALDRYLRLRRKHRYAHLPDLWIHRRGALNNSGVQTMLARRGERAGVGRVHPHQFRHTTAHELKAAGASDDVVMEILGWEDPSMLRKYGKSAAGQRARAAHRSISPSDRL